MNDLIFDSIFNVSCDLIVIPISTEGTISAPFRRELERLNISAELWENDRFKIGDVKILPKRYRKTSIAFACSVTQYESFYNAIRLIGKRLAEVAGRLIYIREIATPILGTGAGGLVPIHSLNIMRTSFYENKSVENIGLTFCTPDEKVYKDIIVRKLDIHTPSSQLAITSELNRIRQNEFVKKILDEKDFYFELAESKFLEYLNYQGSTQFYEQLIKQFESSELKYSEFVKTNLSSVQKEFSILCGELIAYIDYNAYHKNIWNKYPDKRVLAKSAVRQNIWFTNLLRFKISQRTSSLSLSIRNTFVYLTSPDHSLTMLSENHRKNLFTNLFPNTPYNQKNFNSKVIDYFTSLELKPQNPKNLGFLFSAILYLPFIKPIWDESLSNIPSSYENFVNENLSTAIYLIEECLSSQAKELDLGNCGLTNLEILPELFECTHIEKLILSNEWGEYENGKWRKEKSQNEGKNNCIGSLPVKISQLSNLKVLICGGDWKNHKTQEWNRWGVNSLSSITELHKLEFLNLSNNKLKNISGLNKLTALKIVHLNNNYISRTVELEDLHHLKELYISNNRIRKADFISKLKVVETVDLHHNRISDLRSIKNVIQKIGISNDKWEVNTLNIAKNPLEEPPMTIVDLGTEEVLGILEDVEKSGRYVNKDIKIILVGNSEVGKSTLVKYMDKEDGLDEEHLPTLWMDEKIIKSKYTVNTVGGECDLHIFDFGGHDYYHDTHHIFYGNNTIYLLLWDKETNTLNTRRTIQRTRYNQEIEINTQDYPIKYWLDSVKFYTKDVEADNFEFEIKRGKTNNCSLLLIQNKVEDVEKIVFQDAKNLKENYPFIHDIINISIKPKRSLEHFDNMFTEMLNRMHIIGAVLPKFYEPIKQSIARYQGKPVLSFVEFLNYCNSKLKKPLDEDQGKRLVKYLNHVGIILCFNDEPPNKIFIDKNWVIENMHRILEGLTEKNGEFNREYVVQVLKQNDDEVDDLLSMMVEFKIVFKHPYSHTYIAPLYLPTIPDGKINLFLNHKQIPYRRFEYNGFIHKNIILSIFQRYGGFIPAGLNDDIYYYWKDGLIIKNPSSEEVLMIKFHLGNQDGKACIDIYNLTKDDESIFRNDMLRYIREVNKGYEIEEMVTLDGIDYISKGLLEENAKIGKHVFTEKKMSDPLSCGKQQKLFKLKDYMKFIDNNIKKKKVVISYSKKDLTQVHVLRRYLQPLVDAELIEQPWYCTLLRSGDEWNTQIKEKFEEADIVFFMVSEYFYSTKYIIDQEIKSAIDRYDKGDDIKIVPIILEFYDWGRKAPYNLQRFSALPYQAKPISDFHNPKMAWSTITSSIRMMIEKDMDPGKTEIIGRDLEEIYERQVNGKLDNNSF